MPLTCTTVPGGPDARRQRERRDGCAGRGRRVARGEAGQERDDFLCPRRGGQEAAVIDSLVHAFLTQVGDTLD